MFYLVYSAIRNANEGGTAEAFTHAKELIRIQEVLGINHEQVLQQWALHFKPLIVACNYFYGSLHFVVTAGVGIFLFRKWSDDWPLWRNTLAITTGLALIGFILWPLMPPRLLPESYGFVDTLAKYPTFWSFNSGAVSKISNQFAAMPSVHCAWALWCTCVMVPTASGAAGPRSRSCCTRSAPSPPSSSPGTTTSSMRSVASPSSASGMRSPAP